MSCARPLTGYLNAEGRCPHFSERSGVDSARTAFFKCRHCALCRRAHAREWYVRLVNEGYMHRVTCCPTLTYDDEHLDARRSLCVRDWELFLKRLRKFLSERGRGEIRSNAIGEYSPILLRPHIHAALFGYWPADAVRYGNSQSGNPQFMSRELSELWPFGERLTFQYASPGAYGYMARHDAWKLTGAADVSGPVFDDQGANVGYREPEFWRASRVPGIGASFCDKYGEQLVKQGFVVVDGKRENLPSYYLLRLEDRFPDVVSDLKARYQVEARERMADETRERLAVRDECAEAALSRKSRQGVAR